jgi:hypothetical protein
MIIVRSNPQAFYLLSVYSIFIIALACRSTLLALQENIRSGSSPMHSELGSKIEPDGTWYGSSGCFSAIRIPNDSIGVHHLMIINYAADQQLMIQPFAPDRPNVGFGCRRRKGTRKGRAGREK